MGAVEEGGKVEFIDGSEQAFDSLAALRALTTADPGEIEEISIRLRVKESSVWITGNRSRGLSVSADGTQAFASGMVATLKSRLAGGAEAGEQATVVPLRLVDWLLLALIPVLFIGAQVFLYAHFSHDDPVGFALMGLIFAFIPGLIASFSIPEGKEGRRPPPFVLVREGEQFPDEGEPRTGPVWRAKAWFEKHPAVALLSVLVIGAMLGRAAELIKF
jgi:hypothetical protein